MSIANIIDDGRAPLVWTNLKANSLKFSQAGNVLNNYIELSVAGVVVAGCLATATLKYVRVGKQVSLTVQSSDGLRRFTATGAMSIPVANSGAVGARLAADLSVLVKFAVSGVGAAGPMGVEIDNDGEIEFQCNEAATVAGDFVSNFAISYTADV